MDTLTSISTTPAEPKSEFLSSSRSNTKAKDISTGGDTTILKTQIISISLGDSVNLAIARYEITDQIIREDIPSGQWMHVVKEYLASHPEISAYAKIIIANIEKTLEAHREVDVFWSKWIPLLNKDEYSISPGLAASNLLEANERQSGEMFASLFDKAPSKKVRALRGRQSITLIIEDEDYESISSRTDSLGWMNQVKNIPVSVVRNKDGWISTMAHEIQHHTNHRFYDAMLTPKHHYKTFNSKKRDKCNIHDIRIHDEILSQMTMIEGVDMDLIALYTAKQCSKEEIKNAYKEMAQLVEQTLINDYLPLYGSMDTEEEGIIVKEKIHCGVNAFMELKEIFIQKGFNNPVRMTINTLLQFSLKSWPGVSRLVKQRANTLFRGN